MLTPREKSPLPKMSPEEDRTRDAVDSEPKHYQLSYSGPLLLLFLVHASTMPKLQNRSHLLLFSVYASTIPKLQNRSHLLPFLVHVSTMPKLQNRSHLLLFSVYVSTMPKLQNRSHLLLFLVHVSTMPKLQNRSHLLLFSVHASTLSELQNEMSPSLRQLKGWDSPQLFITIGKIQTPCLYFKKKCTPL